MKLNGIIQKLKSEAVRNLVSQIPKLKLVTHPPQRRYHLPDSRQIQKVYYILKSMNYEILEQNSEQNTFSLVGKLNHRHQIFRPHLLTFKNVTVTIQGTKRPNQSWSIDVTLRAHSVLSLDFYLGEFLFGNRRRSAELILDDIANALGWHTFSIIEKPSSKPTLAA